MDLGGWLRSLGLERYEAAFRENEIDETILPNLTAEDLKELGVTGLAHRHKLLDAITALRVEPNKASLGVLLVHGIGSQRCGDTLVRCTTALHSWIRDWFAFSAQDLFTPKIEVELVDASIAEAQPDHPAHTRLMFRRSSGSRRGVGRN
jgi:hypothetical protein